MPAKPGVRIIGLKLQPLPLQTVIRDGIDLFTEMGLVDGFFTVSDSDTTDVCNELAGISREYELLHLATRFEKDKTFGQVVARLVRNSRPDPEPFDSSSDYRSTTVLLYIGAVPRLKRLPWLVYIMASKPVIQLKPARGV